MATSEFSSSAHAALTWAPVCICVLVVAFRVAVRLHLDASGVDDVLMVHAITINVICSAISEAGTEILNPDLLAILALNLESAYEALGALLVLSLAKASVGFQLIRIFGPTSRWRSRIVLVHVWLLTVITVMQIPLAILPVCDADDPDSITPSCSNQRVVNGMGSFYNVFNAWVDIVLSAIPVTLVYRLQISTKKKVTLSLLLGLGVIAGAFSLVREVTSDLEPDNSKVSLIASQLERTLVIVCGSLGAIASIFRHWTVNRPWTSLVTGSEGRQRAPTGPSSWFGIKKRAAYHGTMNTSSDRPLHDPERGQTNTTVTSAGTTTTMRQSSDAPILATNRMNIGFNENALRRV